MSVYIYSGGDRIGILQNEKSVQWIENYRGYGEAKVVCDATAENVAQLAIGNRLYNTDTGTIADIISTDVVEWNGQNELVARALGSAALLDQRVIMATEVITGVEAGLRQCFTDNQRGMPLILGPAQGFPESTQTEITWDSVLQAFITLCEESGLGFRVVFDPDAKTETLEIYKGADRTSGEDYNGYFGTELGNMLNLNLSINQKAYKNVAIVAGEGEGAARVVVLASLGTPTGADRRELYVNAASVKSTYQIATGQVDADGNPTFTEGTYTPEQYKQVLAQKGMEELLKNITTVSISTEVTQNPMEYGKDYFLGDIVPMKSTIYNLTILARILSVTRVYELTGEKLLVELGDFTTIGEKDYG